MPGAAHVAIDKLSLLTIVLFKTVTQSLSVSLDSSSFLFGGLDFTYHRHCYHQGMRD